jgi:asparagine N-glycosylation enzyme membrane subunit Stt3
MVILWDYLLPCIDRVGMAGLPIYQDRKPVDLVFLVWTIIALGMTIARRRFDYYFAINAAIIASFVLVSVSMYLMKNKATMVKIMVVLMIAVCLPLLRADYFISTADTYMPKDWRNATVYLNRYAPNKAYWEGTKWDFGVFSWWDYGYWIMEESHLPAFCTPGTQDDGRASAILVSTDAQKAVASLRTLNLRYVVVDEDMLKDKWYPISKGKIAPALKDGQTEGTTLPWGTARQEDTLVYKLCNQGLEGFKLVYQSGQVKVYEVIE